MNVNAKKLTKMHSSSTPFDDTFRTEDVRMKEWLISLINEAYGTAIDEESEGLIVEIPQSVIEFFLRSRDSSKMRVTYWCGSQEMSVDIPTIFAQKYFLKEMFEKSFFF
ncbi:MAG: hypothetical protein IJ079_00820 [Lachnospiraceae bacterium]|nr:hypothetical protein [Lachnospiraceae bacterium]